MGHFHRSSECWPLRELQLATYTIWLILSTGHTQNWQSEFANMRMQQLGSLPVL